MNKINKQHAVNELPSFSVRFQILATLMILCSAFTGACLGAILSESQVNKDIISWLALPGDLFIRALKCIILPLVFVNIILAMIQMFEAGKAATIGMYTIIIYLLTTSVAAAEGLLMVLFFEKYFSIKQVKPEPDFIRILCPDQTSTLIQELNVIKCKNLTSFTLNSEFRVEDLNLYFEKSTELLEPLSFSETLQENIFRKLVPENVFDEFAQFNFIGVIMFAIVFGAASQAIKLKPVTMKYFLADINDILVKIIEWIIYLTPIAVFSLITGALANQADLAGTLQDIGVLLAATVLADFLHIVILWPIALYVITKTNPFNYMKFLIPAQSFGFSCSSSAATLPVNMRCVKQSGMVPDAIRNFVLPIGATINMDGIAIYFPAALIYLANSAQIETGIAEYFLIVIVATIGSAGTAPVPNGSILLLLTAYKTVYGGEVPEAFGILFGIQWLVDRFSVVVNVTGDAMVARVITHLSDSNVAPDTPTTQLSKYEPSEAYDNDSIHKHTL